MMIETGQQRRTNKEQSRIEEARQAFIRMKPTFVTGISTPTLERTY